jgi:hypothetical protein
MNMTKLTCKIRDLQEICRLVSLKGRNPQGKETLAIPDMLLQVTNRGVLVEAIDPTHALAVRLQYDLTVRDEGQIAIAEIDKFEKYLSRFGANDTVDVDVVANMVYITRHDPYKRAQIPLDDVSSVTSVNGAHAVFENFQLTPAGYPKSDRSFMNLKLTVRAEDLQEVIADGEVVYTSRRTYPFNVKKDTLNMTVGDATLGLFETAIAITESENDPTKVGTHITKTNYSYGLDHLFSNLTGAVNVYLVDDTSMGPMFVRKQTETYSFFAFLAPHMEVE